MGKHAKKKTNRDGQTEVLTGHDEKAERESPDRRLWERVCAAINVYGKTPHCFRHTFATRAYRAGVSEKTLQSMGGWADLKTMQNVYIHTQEEDLENARRLLTLL